MKKIPWIIACAFLAGAAHAESAFFVQLGTAGSESDAEGKWENIHSRYAALLGDMGHSVRAIAAEGAAPRFRLQAGPAKSHEDAQHICAALEGKDVECSIVETAVFSGAVSVPATTSATPVSDTPLTLLAEASDSAPPPAALTPPPAPEMPAPTPFATEKPVEVAPPVATPIATATPPAQLPHFFVQLGTWHTRSEAMQQWDRLKQDNAALLGQYASDIRVPAASLNARPGVRLRVGPFMERAEAEGLCDRLGGHGVGCLVVPE